MKILTNRIIFGILIILNCITIFYFSNQVSDDSTKSSGIIVNIVAEIIPQIKNMEKQEKQKIKEDVLTPVVRKCAHFTLYAFLGLWTINFTNTMEDKKVRSIIYSLIFCILYATTDEIHQYFIPGRSAEARDVLIDSLGALTGILFVISVATISKKIKKQEG